MRTLVVCLAFIGLIMTAAALASPPEGTHAPATVYKLGDPGVTAPVAVKQVRPRYPSGSSQGESSWVVLLDAVVLADGTVGEVTVTKSGGKAAYDEAAVEAARQWTFKPGRREGRAVAVRVPLEMTYTRK